jgi:hypothetical protein
MTKKIQAYFETEDSALHVRDHLLKYNVTNLEISKLEEDNVNNDVPLAVPIVTGGVAQVNSGIMGGTPVIPRKEQTAFHDDQYTIYRAVLSGEINAELYDDAIDLIERNNGHIEEA